MPEHINSPVAPSKAGSSGIVQNNESLARPDETQLKGATRQSAINKIKNKLKGDHPDWADDQIGTLATRMFERAIAKATGQSSNEANAKIETRSLPSAAPTGENFKDLATKGVTNASTPTGLGG